MSLIKDEKIFYGNVKEQFEVAKAFNENMTKIDKLLSDKEKGKIWKIFKQNLNNDSPTRGPSDGFCTLSAVMLFYWVGNLLLLLVHHWFGIEIKKIIKFKICLIYTIYKNSNWLSDW